MVARIPSPGLAAPLPVLPAAPLERAGDPRLDAFQRTLATMLGSQVPVSVLARLGDGSFMVRVADTPVRMALPPGTQPGSQLTMTVLAASPQPAFGLGEATLHGTPLPLSANAASLAASITAASTPLPQASGQAQGADLSPAARLLGQVLQSAAGAPPLASLHPAAPLLPAGAPDAARLAQQLQQAVAKSGLFYESHLAEWAEGKRPLAELMGEPQARKAPGTPPTEPATAQLINQQLATHESGQLVWQGRFGPEQPLRWEVRREDEDGTGPERDDAAPGWHSGLRLRFALLGEVEASVSLRGTRLHIELLADAGAAGVLRAGTPRLQQALDAAGSELAALRVRERDGA
ncbi:flagellar hook-length control protein FliK [Massilia jejuensis]|uniref:Flagellar hook-length control protein FliK n=1 Tax=Massilia jejuensis TaxID=648894 RepID=A0ABW0PCD8_9BURK